MNVIAARRVLRSLLVGSGAVAVGTGGWVVARGTAAIPAGGVASPSVDSVLRFYATWWAGSGLVMLSIASKPEQHPTLVRGVAAATLAGGAARLLAARQSGWPHPLFRVLTALELAAPPLLLGAQRRLFASHGHDLELDG